MTQAEVEQWLSGHRFGRYLSVCSSDFETAVELYAWNSSVAGAALAYVCHFEVALRNAYDRQLAATYPDWAIDPATPLFARQQGHPAARERQRQMNQRSLTDLQNARNGLGASPTHGQVVAAQSFGFWTKITDRDRTQLFWNPMISRVFPHNRRSEIHERVIRINKFRNRLAHNEPVFSSRTGLLDRLADVDVLFDLLAPTASEWARKWSGVPGLVRSCPVTGLIVVPSI